MKQSKIIMMSLLFMGHYLLQVLAGEEIIQSLDRNGSLTFNELENATEYRVEWASSLDGSWTNFTEMLVSIPASGSGIVTCSVPMFYRVVAQVTNTGMVSVEGGTFTMGDTWGDGCSDELPTHSVTISPFYLDQYEVSNQSMVDVLNWANAQGKLTVSSSSVQNAVGTSQELLNLDGSGCQISWNGSSFVVDSGKGSYPCVEVTWYGACAYANYRSEMNGLPACYNLSDWSCNWSATGYRLPTEAEWEYAAKGGNNSNYTKYSGSDTVGDVAWYSGNSSNELHEVGTKAANELGVYDMTGNVWEWCWDWYGSYSSSAQNNPKGSETGSGRVGRGGSWSFSAGYCRVAVRSDSYQGYGYSLLGFRLARPVAQ